MAPSVYRVLRVARDADLISGDWACGPRFATVSEKVAFPSSLDTSRDTNPLTGTPSVLAGVVSTWPQTYSPWPMTGFLSAWAPCDLTGLDSHRKRSGTASARPFLRAKSTSRLFTPSRKSGGAWPLLITARSYPLGDCPATVRMKDSLGLESWYREMCRASQK